VTVVPMGGALEGPVAVGLAGTSDDQPDAEVGGVGRLQVKLLAVVLEFHHGPARHLIQQIDFTGRETARIELSRFVGVDLVRAVQFQFDFVGDEMFQAEKRFPLLAEGNANRPIRRLLDVNRILGRDEGRGLLDFNADRHRECPSRQRHGRTRIRVGTGKQCDPTVEIAGVGRRAGNLGKLPHVFIRRLRRVAGAVGVIVVVVAESVVVVALSGGEAGSAIVVGAVVVVKQGSIHRFGEHGAV